MKKAFSLLKYGETSLAYLRVKNDTCLRDLRSELQFLELCDRRGANYDEYRVLRIALRKGYIYSSIDNVIKQWEGSVIASQNWKDIKQLIEDTKLDTETLGFMLMTIYEHKELKEAREIMLRYHELYDINSVEFPEKIRDICQKMAAEIAIYHGTHPEEESSEEK